MPSLRTLEENAKQVHRAWAGPDARGGVIGENSLVSPPRINYYDDPEAPRASSLVPSVYVVVSNDAVEILMIRRTDNGNWAVARRRSARLSRSRRSSAW